MSGRSTLKNSVPFSKIDWHRRRLHMHRGEFMARLDYAQTTWQQWQKVGRAPAKVMVLIKLLSPVGKKALKQTKSWTRWGFGSLSVGDKLLLDVNDVERTRLRRAVTMVNARRRFVITTWTVKPTMYGYLVAVERLS